MDDQDRFRFIHDLYEFNDEENVPAVYRKQFHVLVGREIGIEKHVRKLLVKIHAFTLMPNHYHMLLSENIDGGITRFMKKLNAGYVRYFNQKHERSGTLFESRFKSVLIKNEKHFIHLPYYIHCNCLDLKFPEWRKRELKNHGEIIDYLNSYRWSSHLDYCGIKNFPSVTQREFLMEYFNGTEGYKKSISGWLENIELETINELLLE